MSLKQKIQEKAKTINELEKILYQKSRYTSREFIYEKDKQETWVTVDDVNTLLDEATKQIRVVTEDVHKALHRRVLDLDSPTRAFIHGVISAQGREVLAVLEGKEKAKPT